MKMIADKYLNDIEDYSVALHWFDRHNRKRDTMVSIEIHSVRAFVELQEYEEGDRDTAPSMWWTLDNYDEIDVSVFDYDDRKIDYSFLEKDDPFRKELDYAIFNMIDDYTQSIDFDIEEFYEVR